jgi:hypothetical protein
MKYDTTGMRTLMEAVDSSDTDMNEAADETVSIEVPITIRDFNGKRSQGTITVEVWGQEEAEHWESNVPQSIVSVTVMGYAMSPSGKTGTHRSTGTRSFELVNDEGNHAWMLEDLSEISMS